MDRTGLEFHFVFEKTRTDHTAILTTFTFGNDPDEEQPHDDYTVPQKVHYETDWKRNQDAVFGYNYPERRIKDCNSGKIICNHHLRHSARRLH